MLDTRNSAGEFSLADNSNSRGTDAGMKLDIFEVASLLIGCKPKLVEDGVDLIEMPGNVNGQKGSSVKGRQRLEPLALFRSWPG